VSHSGKRLGGPARADGREDRMVKAHGLATRATRWAFPLYGDLHCDPLLLPAVCMARHPHAGMALAPLAQAQLAPNMTAVTPVLPVVDRAQGPVTVFIDVAVIPMDRERLLPHQTVVVQDGRITALGATGKVRIPSGATRVDGRGKFLIPGLSDMHTHLSYGGHLHVERQLFILFAAGITTVRNMDFWHMGPRQSQTPSSTNYPEWIGSS
jgi:hypothetical protein